MHILLAFLYTLSDDAGLESEITFSPSYYTRKKHLPQLKNYALFFLGLHVCASNVPFCRLIVKQLKFIIVARFLSVHVLSE